eukprot:SAG31_NODE_2470_length_5649_cov_2.713694_2_plen_168_part_00
MMQSADRRKPKFATERGHSRQRNSMGRESSVADAVRAWHLSGQVTHEDSTPVLAGPMNPAPTPPTTQKSSPYRTTGITGWGASRQPLQLDVGCSAQLLFAYRLSCDVVKPYGPSSSEAASNPTTHECCFRRTLGYGGRPELCMGRACSGRQRGVLAVDSSCLSLLYI